MTHSEWTGEPEGSGEALTCGSCGRASSATVPATVGTGNEADFTIEVAVPRTTCQHCGAAIAS